MATRMKTTSKNANITATQSATLVKNLFRAAFSSIAYVRNYFSEDCFELGKIGSTRFHKLVVTKPEVRHFVDWLEQGVFDALQKEYLDIVLLEVFARDPRKANAKNRRQAKKSQVPGRGELLECFSFTVTYGKDGAQLKLSGSGTNGATSCPSGSKEDIKKNTSLVLRSLVELTQTLEPLPKNRILSIKLLYKPHTPAEYEPPLFSKALEEDNCWFEERPLRVSAGGVTTPYHQLSMSIRAKATPQNVEAKVLVMPAEPIDVDMEKEEMTIVDVGGSQGNSGRVGLTRPPLHESQNVAQTKKKGTSKKKKATAILRLRIKPPGEGSQATAVDSAMIGKRKKRTREAHGAASGETGWTRSRKRKQSDSNSPVHQGEDVADAE